MIRTVRIPKTVSRVGCTPGGGCCDECGGSNMGATHRNSFMGDTPGVLCDDSGNCYDTTTGILISSSGALTLPGATDQVPAGMSASLYDPYAPAGSATNPGQTQLAATTATSGISSTMLIVGGVGIIAALLLAGGSGRRR